MAEWIEIPAHRLLKVMDNEVRDDFLFFGEDGQPLHDGLVMYRAVRKSDGKVFRPPRFSVLMCPWDLFYYLEEL